MKPIFHLRHLVYLVFCTALFSCTSPKEILYFQDIDQFNAQKIEAEYEPVIMNDDKLQIIISGPDKSVVTPYNFTLSDNITGGYAAQSVVPYLVDSDGCIDMPGLGRLKVAGMRRVDLVDFITSMLKEKGLVKDPVVSVSFLNYRITVLGEVRNPGTYVMPSERTTVLQALGMAGDLLITAQREEIILIRDIDGRQSHIKIDLKKSDLLNSPYFYMHQNDVLYVPQSTTRIAQGTAAFSIWSTVLSSITTIIAVISLILK
ncbi:MAG: polysaccharide biosynthesis/export family protein [Bacteroidales bacterium]|nr:polysaccharide biosynthesis/export family protein [Bacteroidales bacterium]MDD4670896.1 polysaccharide biosynthesis/export family protein [Bacteroidales bacterium]